MSYAKKMAQLAAANRKAAQAAGALNEDSKIDSPNEHQTAVVYDLISEGPVEGLQGGTDGIYLDKTPATIGTAGQKFNVRNSNNVSYNSSNHTVTDNNSTLFDNLAVTDGDRYIRIKGAKKTADNASATKGTVVITTGSSFFAEDDESRNDVEGIANLKQYIRLAGAGYRGSALVAEVVRYVSATQVEINRPIVTTVSSVNVTIDAIKKIATITNASTATVSDVTEFGTTDRTVSNVDAELSSAVVSITGTPVYNHQNFQYAFKNGTRSQNWLSTFRGIGSSSVIHSASQQVAQTDLSTSVGIPVDNTTSGGYHSDTSDASASPITISAATMGVSNQSEIDKVKLTFKFPQIIASKKSSGKEASTFVELRMFLGFKRPGDSSFTEVLLKGPSNADLLARPSNQRTRNFDGEHGFNSGYIRANTKTPFVESFTLDLGPFQPISDYQIKIERVNPTNARHGDYDHLNPCELVSIENIIEDKLSYPLSAYAATIFDAQSFAKLPTRAYDVKGLKVKVPTNYFPRGEDGRTAAEYDRNVTSGANEGSYQQWDGNFRGDTDTFNNSSANFSPVWTDNPAWVYYDLVTNNRYGIGKYITEDQIDKYELFKIAKYCDELVSDGKGGTEPRFTCNLYLQESDEAFKVLQNVASIFRGMLYWFDGLMQFSQNRYQTPVYTFNKSNVIAGMFKYTSSKKQYRSNQVNVTWNDPEAFFKKAVETVEDTNNILETGRVVTKDVVAFGCTSRGQAHRFGKWTLLTELMETEGIAFDTSINAGYLKPGDVIFVQDAAKEQIRNSGRISTGSTTTAIKVDSAVDLSSGNTYKLSIIYPTGGAFLAQETAVIDSTTFNRGDLILQANIGGSVTTISTSQQAQNALDDSGNLLDLSWNPNSRVETQTISSTGASTTTINVSSAFSSAPPQDAAWAIREIATDGTLESGSAQQYIISAINNTEKGIYNIAALKYEPAKFDLVDRGYVLDVGIDTNKPPSYQDEVPVPKSLTLAFVAGSVESVESEGVDLESSTGSLRVSWQHPTSIRTDSAGNSVTSKYEHLNNYQIRHNASGRAIFETILVDKDTNHIDIPVQRLGRITVQIQTVNTGGIKSAIVQKRINTKENEIASIPNTKSRIGRLPIGGQLDISLSINSSSGVLDFSSSTYSFIAANGEPFAFSSTGTGNTQQAFNGMGASAEAYLVFDADDTSDHLKAIEVKTDTTAEDAGGNKLNFEYLAEVGASNAGISSASGTATISLEESTVTGSSTAFLTDYSVGDRFIINAAGTTRFFATVTNITSDTEMEIDNPVPRAYSGASIFKLSYKPDFVKDTILAKIVTTSGTVYSIDTVFAVTSGTQGPPGNTGSAGLKQVQGYLYYEKTSNTGVAPSTPGSTTYTFATGDIDGGSGATEVLALADTSATDKWTNAPRTQDVGSTSSFWTVRYTGGQSSSGDATCTVTYSSIVKQTAFTGVVTFSGGTFSEDGSSITTIDGANISTGTIAADRIKLSGSGALTIGSLTNDSGFITSSGAPVQSVAGSTGAVSAATIISAGNIIVQGDNISTLTNNENFIDGTQVNSNVTAISGGSITTGTVAAARIAVSDIVIGDLSGAGSFKGALTNITNPSSTTTPIGAGDVNSNVTAISGGVITTGTINSDRLNVNTLNVKQFADVTANIINHNGNTVPLTRFASNYITTGNSGGSGVSTHSPVSVTNCRSGGSFVAYIQGILGDVQNMQVEFSEDGGSTYSLAANGPVFTINAGTFRPHTFLYHDTLNFSGSNQTAHFRIRFNGKANFTQIGLTVIVDNTN